MRFLGSLSVIDSGTKVQDGEQNQSKVVGDKEGRGPVSFEEDWPPTQLQAKLFRPIPARFCEKWLTNMMTEILHKAYQAAKGWSLEK